MFLLKNLKFSIAFVPASSFEVFLTRKVSLVLRFRTVR